MNKNWDVWTYWLLTAILVIYAFYIKGTCEELGCLAIIIPIIGILILSGLEFITGMIILLRNKGKSPGGARITTLIISGIITILTIIGLSFG